MQPRCQALHPEHVDAGGRKLDCQRNAVEPVADIGDAWGIEVREYECIIRRLCPLGKQQSSGRGQDIGCRDHDGPRRQAEWRQAMHPLAGRAQRLAARDQDMDTGGGGQHSFRQPGDCLGQVLAVVEQEQHLPFPQQCNEVRGRIAREHLDLERGGDGVRQELRIDERREVDNQDMVTIAVGKLLGDSHGDRRLAHAARARDGHEPLLLQAPHQVTDHGLAADQPNRRGRDAGRWRVARWIAAMGVLRHVRDVSDEAVASARHVDDVLRRGRIVVQRLAQGRDVDPQRCLIDVKVRPYPGDEVLLADQLPRPLHQGEENLERTAAQPDAMVTVVQGQRRRQQSEPAEKQRLALMFQSHAGP